MDNPYDANDNLVFVGFKTTSMLESWRKLVGMYELGTIRGLVKEFRHHLRWPENSCQAIREIGFALHPRGKESARGFVVRVDRARLSDRRGLGVPDRFLNHPVSVESWCHQHRASTPMFGGTTGIFGKRRPITPGSGLQARGLQKLGTMGCIVQRGDDLHALTCEHVLSKGILSPTIGTAVDFLDAHTQKPAALLGHISMVGGIKPRAYDNEVDCALVKLTKEAQKMASASIPGVGRLDATPLGFDEIHLAMPVLKVGTRTGLTHGTITGFYSIRINYGDGDWAGFNSFIQIEPMFNDHTRFDRFCGTGDSGSLIVSIGHPAKAVGLLASHSGVIGRGYAAPIVAVLDRFDATIWTG